MMKISSVLELTIFPGPNWNGRGNRDVLLHICSLPERKRKKKMATTGLEPVTLALLAPRSNQLS